MIVFSKEDEDAIDYAICKPGDEDELKIVNAIKDNYSVVSLYQYSMLKTLMNVEEELQTQNRILAEIRDGEYE